MNRYAYRINREVTYNETVEAIIIAKTEAEAERIAAGIGDGESPNWPNVDRYNTSERTPQTYELLNLEKVRG